MATHHVVYGAGAQTIRESFVDEGGEDFVPSTASATIVDLRYPEDADASVRILQASTAGTPDSTSTTSTAIAGTGAANKRKIVLTSESGFVEGRRYLITSSSGESEAFEVDHVDTSNSTVYAVSELRRSYPVGSTVQGLEVEFSIPSSVADSETLVEEGGGPFALDWILTGTTSTHVRSLLWIRRGSVRSYGSVEDVLHIDQSLGEVARKRLKLETCISQANRDFRRLLRARGVDPAEYVGGEEARDAVAYRAAELARQQMGGDASEMLAERYGETFRAIMNSLGGEQAVETPTETDKATKSAASRLSLFGLM